MNAQGETNLYNLKWFHGREEDGSRKSFLKLLINGDRLFSVLWLGFGVVVPLLDRCSRRLRRWCAAIGMPVFPVAISGLFLGELCYV